MYLCLLAYFPHSLTHSLTSSPCLSAPLTSPLLFSHPHPLLFPYPCWHAAVKGTVAPDESSFEASRALGTSRRVLYICGFLVKLQISPLSKHLHYLRLYPSTGWWLAEIVMLFFLLLFFFPFTSPLAPQSFWTDGVSVIINNLGKTYYGVEAMSKRENVREQKKRQKEYDRVHGFLLHHLSCLLLFSCICVRSNTLYYQKDFLCV